MIVCSMGCNGNEYWADIPSHISMYNTQEEDKEWMDDLFQHRKESVGIIHQSRYFYVPCVGSSPFNFSFSFLSI